MIKYGVVSCKKVKAWLCLFKKKKKTWLNISSNNYTYTKMSRITYFVLWVRGGSFIPLVLT